MTDREKGKLGERKVKELLEDWGYSVEDLSENPEYYYKGDLRATSSTTG